MTMPDPDPNPNPNPNPGPCPCDPAELAKRCRPQLESLLNGAATTDPATLGPHVQQIGMSDAVPFLANAVLTLVAKYGPGVAQQALDLIKAELGKLSNAPTAAPGV
jgi:hypothetical protein